MNENNNETIDALGEQVSKVQKIAEEAGAKAGANAGKKSGALYGLIAGTAGGAVGGTVGAGLLETGIAMLKAKWGM